jgi:hypothetical protein
MAVVKGYKVLKNPTNRTQKDLIEYLLSDIPARKINAARVQSMIERMKDSDILEEVKYGEQCDFWVRWDKAIHESVNRDDKERIYY